MTNEVFIAAFEDVEAARESFADKTSLPDRFIARPWSDPAAERIGFPVNSFYTEAVLLPVLGPATTLLLRRVGSWAAANPNGVEVDTQQLARDLGLGDSLARSSAMSRTLTRLCQFDMAHWVDNDLAVRSVVNPLAERHLRRLSPELVKFHNWMVTRQMAEVALNTRQSVVAMSPAQSADVSLG